MEVMPVSEARAGLSRLLVDFRADPELAVVVIGSHRRPEAALMPFSRYRELADAEPQDAITMARLRRLKPVIERLAQAAHLGDVRVYGSVARGDQTPDSDLDLLVTAEPDATLFDIAQFELDMEVLLETTVSATTTGALDAERDRGTLSEAVAL